MDERVIETIEERQRDLYESFKNKINEMSWLKDVFAPYAIRVDMNAAQINNFGHTKYANLSSEYSELITCAGRYCVRFASDVIISINSLEEWLKESNPHEEKVFVFGFREFGVDHEAFVEASLPNANKDIRRLTLQARYRALYLWYIRRGEDDSFESVFCPVTL